MFTVKCPNNAELVLHRAKSVMESVLNQTSNDSLNIKLPSWFINDCVPERTHQEAEEWLIFWRSLSEQEKANISKEQKWSLQNWLYWFEPDMRVWFWWDAFCDDANTIRVDIEVHEWPLAWGALDWLFRASGATSITY